MRSSPRTFVLALAAFGAFTVVRTLQVLGVGGSDPSLASRIGATAVIAAAGIAALALASRIPASARAERLSWFLVAAGVLCVAIGDGAGAVQELAFGFDPHPGIADGFRIARYVLVGAALWVAGTQARDRGDVPTAVSFSAAVTLMIGLAAWYGLLAPHGVGAAPAPPGEAALNVLYPMADVLVLFGPALAVLFLSTSHERPTPPWQWVALCAGAIALAVSDAGYSLMAVAGTPSTAAVDYGWMLAHVLMAIGASLALDAVSDARRPTVTERHARQPASSSEQHHRDVMLLPVVDERDADVR